MKSSTFPSTRRQALKQAIFRKSISAFTFLRSGSAFINKEGQTAQTSAKENIKMKHSKIDLGDAVRGYRNKSHVSRWLSDSLS